MPSPYLLRNFQKNTTYHLTHQALLNQPFFQDSSDYKSFLLTLSYYLRFPDGAPLSWVPRLSAKALAKKQGVSKFKNGLPVTLNAFVLLPNHFHLLLTENIGSKKLGTTNNSNNTHPAKGGAGISELMRRLSVGYAMTYRHKYGGKGTIFKGKYKMTPVQQNQLPAMIKYLHTHPETNSTYIKDKLHSSFIDYTTTSRSWVKPLPTSDFVDIATLGKLTLER